MIGNGNAYALIFLIGASIGAFGAYQYAKQKYEKIAAEEIDSVKELYLRKEKEWKEKEEKEKENY